MKGIKGTLPFRIPGIPDFEQLRLNLLLVAVIAVGAVLSFVMFALAARAMGPTGFGQFATVFNALSFLAVAATLGQETLIGRSWNEYIGNRKYDLAMGSLIYGSRNVLIGALLAGACIIGYSFLVGKGGLTGLSITAFVVLQTILCFTTSVSRTVAGVVSSTNHAEVTWRLLTVVGILWALLGGATLAEGDVFWMVDGAILVALLLQILVSYRALPAEVNWRRSRYKSQAWRARATSMWGAALLEATNQYVDVILIGLLIDPVAAGGYFAASRIANGFAKISLAASVLGASRISLLFFHQPRAELVAFMRALALCTGLLVIVALGSVLILGSFLLSLFGTIYTAEYQTLIVLSIGTAAAALSGPAPYLLMHTGNETLYTKTIGFGLLLRLVLFAILAPRLGSIGAAFAFTIAALVVALALNIACRLRTGVDPSILTVSGWIAELFVRRRSSLPSTD